MTSYSKRKISRWVLPAYTKRIGGDNTLEGLLTKEGRCLSYVMSVVVENSMNVRWKDGYQECLVVNILVEPESDLVG